MNKIKSLLTRVASAAFFIACTPAIAQWQVPDNAIAIGRGSPNVGFKNVPLPSGSLLIGQAGIPLAIIPTGDVTISAAGVTAIGATKVTSAMLNSNVYSTAHSWSGQQTFVAPILGTPASGTMTNVTGLPISTGVAGLGTGVATALAVNVGAAGSPVINGGVLGTPSSGTATNLTGLPIATGVSGLGTNVGSFLVTPSSANLRAALTDETGTGVAVFGTSPNITTPTGIVKGDVGLGNVDNTSDATKWAATKTLTNTTYDTAGTGNSFSINGVAATANTGTGSVVRAASPTLTGIPAAPTAAPSNNSTQIATTAYVDAQVAGGVSGVASLNGKTGALVSYYAPQGRLTLISGSAVPTSSTAGATTVYYTPYVGNMVPIYDGTNIVPTAFAEVSQATTDTTKSPAALGASQVADVFCWVDTGPTNRCTRSFAWTNDTTRCASCGLTYVNGIAVNTTAITNGPAAQRGTWVGTVGSNASSTVDYIFGALGSGGVAGVFNVWNAYNRVQISTSVRDNTDTWGYSVAGTWRAANASSTIRVTSLRGADVDPFVATYGAIGIAGASTIFSSGVGLDSTTAFCGRTGFNATSGATTTFPAQCSGLMGLGRHFVSAIEYNSTTTTSTAFGDGGGALIQSGFDVTLWQ